MDATIGHIANDGGKLKTFATVTFDGRFRVHSIRLKNPIAAEALVHDVQKAIQDRLSCAEAFEPYHSAKDRQYP